MKAIHVKFTEREFEELLRIKKANTLTNNRWDKFILRIARFYRQFKLNQKGDKRCD